MTDYKALVSENTPLISTNRSDTSTNGDSGEHASSKNKNDTHQVHVESSPASSSERKGYKDETPTWKEMMEILLPFLYPNDTKHTICALAALFSMLTGKIVEVLPPLAIKYAVDIIAADTSVDSTTSSAESPPDARPVMYAILIYFGLKILSMTNDALQDLAQRTVALDAERRFGVVTFAHLHTLSLSYHLEKHIGEVTRVMSRGADSISTLLSSFLFFLAPTLFEIAVVSTVFWKLGTPSIALSTVCAIAVYLLFTLKITNTRIAYRRKLIEASDNVSSKETETLVNYETVTMFGRTQYEISAYDTLRSIYRDRRVEMLSMFALMQFGQNFIRLCGVCAGLLIAGHDTVTGDLSAGTFVVIQMYIQQLFQPLTALGWQYRMLTQAFTDVEKAVTMLKRVPEVQDAPHAIPFKTRKSVSGEMVFNKVSFHYKIGSRKRPLGTSVYLAPGPGGGGRHFARRGRMALGFCDEGVGKASKHEDDDKNLVQLGGVDDISFCLPAGKTAALVGPSGSGKTTIIRLVLRLYDTDSGTVHIDGQNVKDLTQQSLRENIGVVAQDTILFNASLRENIIYGKPDATLDEIWSAVHTAALTEFIKGLPDQLDTIVGDRGMKLSGGERQRVGLARCVIKNPQLILLDEATSALDTATEREIQKNIAQICKGRTTLMIAHRLSTARNADQIIVLEKGRICERGTHDELLNRNEKYAKMWQIQTEAVMDDDEKDGSDDAVN